MALKKNSGEVAEPTGPTVDCEPTPNEVPEPTGPTVDCKPTPNECEVTDATESTTNECEVTNVTRDDDKPTNKEYPHCSELD